jgi:hypothetical protein
MLEGVFEAADCTSIRGWAADRGNPSATISVNIFDGSTLLQTVAANQPNAGSTVSGDHGFVFNVPQSLRDGNLHSISVKFFGTSSHLTNSPRSLVCSGGSAPTPPTNLRVVSASGSQINLAWNPSTGQNGYRIERKVGAGGAYVEIATAGANTTTYQDTGRSAGITYFYRVRAFNGFGNSAYSGEVQATIPGGSGVPAAPSGLVGTVVSTNRINLTWTDNSNNETRFIVERKQGTGSFVAIASLSANTTAHADTKVKPTFIYTYRVIASNTSGNSQPSNQTSPLQTTGTLSCQTVSGLSGLGGSPTGYNYLEGAGQDARWRSPSSATTGIDPVSGLQALFIADTDNHSIRMVYLEGPAEGHSIRLAGSGIAGYWEGNGDPYEARYNYPQGIAAITNQSGVVDALLIADTDNHVIRMLLAPAGGTQWRPMLFSGKGNPGYADGEPLDTFFNGPRGITVGPDRMVYVADTFSKAVRRLDLNGFSTTYFRQMGLSIFQPVGIAISSLTGDIYVSDQATHAIYVVTGGTKVIVAGSGSPGYADGNGTAASFNTPQQVAFEGYGGKGTLYITDQSNNRVRLLDLAAEGVTTWAGIGVAGYNNADCGNAQFNSPAGVALGAAGELYVIDRGNNSIRKVE